ncbi:hypothetical protein ACI2IY_20140 [Lysobacter enzymogenes]|uniref:hypothetical protein n=1 Tax=Lysobacter enzymogenes TaxID=69 RepID=UPI00384C23F2
MFAMSIDMRRSAHKRAGLLAAALRAFALTAVLLFSASAQADPVELERIMQTVRSERAGFESNLLQAYQDLDSGLVAEAQHGFGLARADTTALSAALAELDAEMDRSMQAGEYTDKRALAIAVQHGKNAKKLIDTIDAYLQLMQDQPHPFTRALIDSRRPAFDEKLAQLETELANSQA